jgi:hypothetical protein
MPYGPRIPDSEFARFESQGYIGVMINVSRDQMFMFSMRALQEYAKVTPGFNWREYHLGPDFGREIERTDPKMIDIVRRIGYKEASEGDCRIAIKLVPWECRHDFDYHDMTDDLNDNREKVFFKFQARTLRIPN